MRKGKNHDPKFRLNLADIVFKIQRDLKAARATIDYSKYHRDGGGQNRISVSIPISCIWVDSSTGNACKCHMKANMSSDAHRLFVRDLVSIGTMSEPGGSMTLTSSPDGIIRYGEKPGAQYYGSDRSTGRYETYYMYDSKESALMALIASARQIKPVGGVELVSLSKIDDSVLTSMGFDRVPDIMKNGVTMWRGNAEKAFEPRGHGYSTKAMRIRRDNINTFLGLMQKSLDNE